MKNLRTSILEWFLHSNNLITYKISSNSQHRRKFSDLGREGNGKSYWNVNFKISLIYYFTLESLHFRQIWWGFVSNVIYFCIDIKKNINVYIKKLLILQEY